VREKERKKEEREKRNGFQRPPHCAMSKIQNEKRWIDLKKKKKDVLLKRTTVRFIETHDSVVWQAGGIGEQPGNR